MVGERLRRFREAAALSQVALAERLGVSRITIVRWENGTAKPSQLAASKLEALGFGPLSAEETNLDEVPQLHLGPKQLSLFGDGPPPTEQHEITIGGRSMPIKASPYVGNGPRNQLSFFSEIYRLQAQEKKSSIPTAQWAERLSAVKTVPGLTATTSQHRLENPKPNAAHWNPNYGTHGWHRYIGRFPPHLVRAILNYFHATNDTVVCDPFAGSGTTLVECRLLGIPAVGIEICPLSAMMSRVKSTYPVDTASITAAVRQLNHYYEDKWIEFTRGRDVDNMSHEVLVNRIGNTLPAFSNYQKWLTPSAFLGISIVLEFATRQKGYIKDFILIALSSKMRSIGNVDVDVARAEYRKEPRKNVNVISTILSAVAKMCEGIDSSMLSHASTIGTPESVNVIHSDVLAAKIAENSIDHVITSPPYGVEASSYLRAHLLSYRCLHAFLGEDPYAFGDRVIGSEYVRNGVTTAPEETVGKFSDLFRTFFDGCLAGKPQAKIVNRAHMMMQFFADMNQLVMRMAKYVKPKGKIAFVIGNKKIGDNVVPTDKIMSDIFLHHGFTPNGSVSHKLKCNNTNSQVPWQERIIQEEFVLFFSQGKKK